MMKKLANIVAGKVFTYAKERFVVLEQTSRGVFVLLEQNTESVPFHDGNDEPRNDYRKSSLKQYIENDWLRKLIANGADEADMLDFTVNLCETDGSKAYGVIEVKAAPLTLAQYGKYKDIIPFAEDDGWWLVTPLWGPWLRSPYTSGTNGAWLVNSSGAAHNDDVSDSYGVRPVLLLSSDLLVSAYGEDEDDSEDVEKALAKFDTLTLIREVERRMTRQECECGCDRGDCDYEDDDE